MSKHSDDIAERILEAAQIAELAARALARVRLLLAEYGHARVNSFADVVQADHFFECEQIAKRMGADAIAADIRRVGKLDEVQVFECKAEDIGG